MSESAPGESVTRVDTVEPETYGGDTIVYPIWGWDEIPAVPHSGAGRAPRYRGEIYTAGSMMPAPGGISIGASTFPGKDQTLAEAMAGAHRSDTIDIGVVVSGEIVTISTDGAETVLRPGDVYIQDGAIHAWRTNPDNPAHVVFICIGAPRRT